MRLRRPDDNARQVKRRSTAKSIYSKQVEQILFRDRVVRAPRPRKAASTSQGVIEDDYRVASGWGFYTNYVDEAPLLTTTLFCRRTCWFDAWGSGDGATKETFKPPNPNADIYKTDTEPHQKQCGYRPSRGEHSRDARKGEQAKAHHGKHNRRANDELPVAQTVANLVGIGIDYDLAEPKAYEDVPIGYKPENTALKCHAVRPSVNLICINVA